MKLNQSLELLGEASFTEEVLQNRKQYEGTLVDDYLSHFKNRPSNPEEEKALHYGLQAMLATGRESKTEEKISVDVNRTLQALKMNRKGFQNQMRKKEEAWAREAAGMQNVMKRLEQEWQELSQAREQAREQAMVGTIRKSVRKQKEERERTDVSPKEQLQEYERRYGLIRLCGLLWLAVGVLAGVFLIPFPWKIPELALLVLSELGFLFAARKVKEEQFRYQKRKQKERKQLEALVGNLEEIEERMRLKEKQIAKEQRKYQNFMEKTKERQPEEVEMDALSLAIQTISWMSASRTRKEKLG